MYNHIREGIHNAFIKIFILSLTISGSQPYILAQSNDKAPKVALVLSGGGALGMAHVGVLKVMEEAGLRPDYITGVSMGSIIGGMYSVGYTADSIYKILKMMDWELLFSRSIPENKVIFPEKEHFNNSIISLPVSVRKIKLPSGLINGQQIENQLNYYFWPAAGINDFSKLPIPFMCLGADILTGRIVELKTGYLPEAIRASIAIPTIFTPVKIDTALLVDGGVLRNFAAGEARKMGADIIIGSYTGFQIYTEDQLQSMPEIVRQIVFQRSSEDFQTQKQITDLLIEPNLEGFSRMAFASIDSIIERGYKAALPHKEYFKKLADSLNRLETRKPLENILDRQTFVFDKIELTGNKIYPDYQILGFLDIGAGEKIDKKLINERIDLLYGKRWFEKVKYRILSRNDSLVLVIDCIEEPKVMLYGGVYYDNYIRSGIVFRMTFKDLLTRKSFIDLDSYVGQFYRGKLTLLQFIDRNQKVGIRTVFYVDNTRVPELLIKRESGRLFIRDFYTELSVIKYLGLNHLMNISVNLGNSSFAPDFISLNHLNKVSYKYLSGSYNYQINTLDTKHFPDKGTLLQLTAGTSKLLSGRIRTDFMKETYNATNPGEFSFKRTFSLLGSFRHYFPTGKKTTLSFKGDLLLTYDPDSVTSLHNLYYLGGIESLNRRSVPFIGFHSNEIAVNKLAGVGTDIDIEVFKDVHLSVMADFFAAREIYKNENISLFAGYGLGIGYMSIIGPLKIGIMNGLSNNDKYSGAIKGYISIGYRF
jgi:NTE family protein